MLEKNKTSFFNKLHSGEIEDYLRRNDIIFIPFGTVAAHGGFPMDVEETFARGLALKMAEKVDGLVFGNLPFFYAGAAMTGRGTVQISIREGIKYLKEISYSLLNQGFRRQIYVSTCETGFMTAGGVVIDFFDEIKCPITYMNLESMINVAMTNNPGLALVNNRLTLDTMMYGAYKILGKLGEVVVDPDAPLRHDNCPEVGLNTEYFSKVTGQRRPAGAVGYYYKEPDDHYGPYGAVRTFEDLEVFASKGEQLITDLVEALDMERYVASMKTLDVWTNTYIKTKYAGNLPKNKFAEWR